MIARSVQRGRKAGSTVRGFYYRKGRGWHATKNGQPVALRDDNGKPFKKRTTPQRVLQLAYAAWLTAQGHEAATAKPATARAYTVQELVKIYLDQCETVDAPATYKMRADHLFDFCTGLPPKYRVNHITATTEMKELDRLHPGFGGLLVSQLVRHHVDRWIQAHPGWGGSRRPAIQALKRVFNYAVEKDLISSNPIKGYSAGKAASRLTYVTPEQEEGIYRIAKHAFALAVKVCIRTGARYGCEFATVTAANVVDEGSKMQWVWEQGTKVRGKKRTILITDPEIIEIVRKLVKLHPTGPIFRNSQGKPWTQEAMKTAFERIRDGAKAKKLGIVFSPGTVLYSTRHTYAKRILSGYWNDGKPTNIHTLAKLMGNTPEEAQKYADWDQSYTDPLWDAC